MSVHAFPNQQRANALPLPECIEAEQCVLGGLLLRNGDLAGIAPHVAADDFGEAIHRAIFDVSSRLIGEGKPATPASLRPYLGDRTIDGTTTIPQYLALLCREASVPGASMVGYAKLIRSVSVRRRLVEVAAQLDEAARDVKVGEDSAELAAGFAGELQHLAAAAGTDTTRHVAAHLDMLMTTVADVRSGTVEHRCVTTGYPDLDAAMNGYEPGTLVIVAGRPGMGKSIYMNASARRCAQRAGVGVVELPLEIGANQLVARHLADLAYAGDHNVIAFRDIGRRARELSDQQAERLHDAGERLRALPIAIDSRSRITVPQIAAKVAQVKRAMAAQGVPLGVVMIDHLDFIHAGDRYRGSRVLEIGEICISLKDLARTENVCVVLLCQLNRDVEKRTANDRRPGLADLRNSGDIEQVADVVMFMYREEYYLTRSPEYLAGDPAALDRAIDARGRLELILGKVRAGPTPTVHLWCSPAASSISSFQRGRA